MSARRAIVQVFGQGVHGGVRSYRWSYAHHLRGKVKLSAIGKASDG
jgi:hypothetical protein